MNRPGWSLPQSRLCTACLPFPIPPTTLFLRGLPAACELSEDICSNTSTYNSTKNEFRRIKRLRPWCLRALCWCTTGTKAIGARVELGCSAQCHLSAGLTYPMMWTRVCGGYQQQQLWIGPLVALGDTLCVQAGKSRRPISQGHQAATAPSEVSKTCQPSSALSCKQFRCAQTYYWTWERWPEGHAKITDLLGGFIASGRGAARSQPWLLSHLRACERLLGACILNNQHKNIPPKATVPRGDSKRLGSRTKIKEGIGPSVPAPNPLPNCCSKKCTA